jgi:hypothetical protein
MVDMVEFLMDNDDDKFEYGVQYYWEYAQEWRMMTTNAFKGWYPSKSSAKNALAQLRATRYGWKSDREYRLVRRPIGEVEVLEG